MTLSSMLHIESGREDYVITDRGGIVENRYSVHAAIVDAGGKILYAVGDPTRLTLARSAAKPAQALAIMETGGFDQFNFDDRDLALICASHSSEDRHISRIRDMLTKVGVSERDLRCGGHPALSTAVNRSWIKRDYIPTASCSMCAGKHAGMLAGTRAIGADVANYHLSDSPMQLRVKKVFSELCNLNANELKWALDGCNLPAPAFPLRFLAQVYAFFAASVDAVHQHAIVTDRLRDSSRIFHAMAQHPELVGGEGRFCTELMMAFRGSIIGKLGADGCYGIGIPESEQTRQLGSDGAIGIAVKIEDGNVDILYSAVVEILQQLNIGTPAVREQLSSFHCQEILNTVGIVTGHVSHSFKVRREVTHGEV